MLRAATRGSALARWQTDHVASLLGEEVEAVVVDTEGDRRRDEPLERIAGRGVFVKEVQAALLDGRAEFAVHSAKDLPASIPVPGLTLAAVPERADPRDCLVGARLGDLAPGAVVATGSTRRLAQLAWLRPDLSFTGLRGNIGTRLERVPPGGAVVMAHAAVQRLGLTEHVAEVLDRAVMLPQVAQGALAVECRADDLATLQRLAAIDHRPSRLAVEAERAFLRAIGGGCDAPAGAHATVATGEAETVTLEVLVASRNGRQLVRCAGTVELAGAAVPEARSALDGLAAELAGRLPASLLAGTAA